jgi:hypothetical protein
MQVYLVLMVLAVVIGTLFDISHKGSAKFFALRKEKSNAAAQKRLSGGERFLLEAETVAEAAVSGEFCKWPRWLSHLLMMYGFFIYIITTVVMVFAYPGAARIPSVLPALWTLGASMILIGGLWFFFFLRVNVAAAWPHARPHQWLLAASSPPGSPHRQTRRRPTVQQGMALGDIVDVGRGADD